MFKFTIINWLINANIDQIIHLPPSPCMNLNCTIIFFFLTRSDLTNDWGVVFLLINEDAVRNTAILFRRKLNSKPKINQIGESINSNIKKWKDLDLIRWFNKDSSLKYITRLQWHKRKPYSWTVLAIMLQFINFCNIMWIQTIKWLNIN